MAVCMCRTGCLRGGAGTVVLGVRWRRSLNLIVLDCNNSEWPPSQIQIIQAATD